MNLHLFNLFEQNKIIKNRKKKVKGAFPYQKIDLLADFSDDVIAARGHVTP